LENLQLSEAESSHHPERWVDDQNEAACGELPRRLCVAWRGAVEAAHRKLVVEEPAHPGQIVPQQPGGVGGRIDHDAEQCNSVVVE